MAAMAKNALLLSFALLILLASASPTSPAKIVNNVFSNLVSALMKWVLSLKSTSKTAITGRPLMKFESGYNVETVFDGSKLGIEPYALEVLSNGELLILDSSNSNLYKISSTLSLYSRPKLVVGSADGYSGYIDGRLREARMNHPKGLTVDDKGNVYIADAANMAIRKISDTGVTTIAGGGKSGRGGGHVDGPSQDARFSNDFDVVYVGSSCSLLVIDRENGAIREIQLPYDDCADQYGSGFPLGIAVLIAAGFFGYMLALLQRRVGTIVSSQMDQPYRNQPPPPLIPPENHPGKQETGLFESLTHLTAATATSFSDILQGLIPGLRKPPLNHHFQNHQQPPFHHHLPPVQDSYVIPDDDEPPPPALDPQTPKKTYSFMTKDAHKMQQLRQSRNFYEFDGNFRKQQQQQQQQYDRYQFSGPETYYEKNTEKIEEIVFGAVQEKAESVVIKPLDHGNSIYDRHGNLRSRGFFRRH